MIVTIIVSIPDKDARKAIAPPFPTPKMLVKNVELSILLVNTKSTNGPLKAIGITPTNCAMNLRAEKTLPCISTGTMLCQIAWLEAFATTPGIAMIITEATTRTTVPAKPRINEPMADNIIPRISEITFLFVPPHTVIRSPPRIPPIPKADSTIPKITLLLLNLASIIGESKVPHIPLKRFVNKNTESNASRAFLL